MADWSNRELNRTATQSLFNAVAPGSSWRSYLTSGFIHTVILALMLAISFPMVQETQKPRENIILIAPAVPVSQTRIPVPRPMIEKRIPARPVAKIVQPLIVRPPEIKPQVIASAPIVKDLPPMPRVPDRPVPVAKPEIHTGVFENSELAKSHPEPKLLKVGGFGDPQGVPASPASQPSSAMLAKVGSFDLPNGEGKGGANGRAQGGVRQTSFGSVEGTGGTSRRGGPRGSVETGGFGDSAAVANEVDPAKPAQPVTTPVAILFKPKPVYTEEARNLKLEGQVSLQVVFLATGSVHIVRVLRGLGHGLDEAAQTAALQVRFRPATRTGVPVDTSATIYITFELT